MTNAAETTIVPHIQEHIAVTPGICGGKPRIAGHRIKVQHIAIWHERMGLMPDEILANHPGLTLGDVYAALAYYWDHRNAIDADIAADEEFVRHVRAQAPPSLFQSKLQQYAQNHSLPSE